MTKSTPMPGPDSASPTGTTTRALRLVCATLLASGSVAAQEPPSALTWETEPQRSLTLLRGKEVVWKFHADADHPKPCFHPLSLPGGRVLTVDRPKDHLWHHGLWFSWKYIDGVNFWENAGVTGKPAGKTGLTVTTLEGLPGGEARIELGILYWPKEAPVLKEQRQIRVSAPSEDGSYSIDWSARFEALAACKLDRTPPPGEKDGKSNGGYAGLSVRLVQMDERDAATSAGPVEWNAQSRARETASAFDYRGVLAGKEVGIAILDHPKNLRHPSPWYGVRTGNMTFFNAAVICPSPHEMKQGDKFSLRYRVVVHPGRLAPEDLARRAEEFAKTSQEESK